MTWDTQLMDKVQTNLQFAVLLLSQSFHRALKVLRGSRSRRSVRFRRIIFVLLVSALTLMLYINMTFNEIAYLSRPIVINSEDVTGMSELPLESRELVEYSRFPQDDYQPRGPLDGILPSSTFDPRLMPALVLVKLRTLVQRNELTDQYKLPFSWNAWLDLDIKLKANHKWYNYFHRSDFTCDSFYKFYLIDPKLDICEPLKEDEIQPGFPHFKITGPSDARFYQEARAIMGASYLKFVMSPPERVIFLGIDDNDGALILPTTRDLKTGDPVSGDRDLALKLAEELLREKYRDPLSSPLKVFKRGVSLLRLITRFAAALDDSDLILHRTEPEFDIPVDVVRIVNYGVDDGQQLPLHRDEFLWNTKKEIAEMKHRVLLSGGRNVHNLDYRLLKQTTRMKFQAPNFPKHFHESPIIDRPTAGAHYDWRFFNRLDIPYYEHVAILHRMVRAWLRFSRASGLNTWVLHGTMLSWYWNGLNLPWDTDLDVQVTMFSLYKMARSYNNSLVTDLTLVEARSGDPLTRLNVVEGPTGDPLTILNVGIGKFFLDVGPSFFSRVKGNGNNAIDARFIDTYSGLYIDITALLFNDFYHDKKLKGNDYKDLMKVLDANYTSIVDDQTVDKELYEELLRVKKKQLFKEKQIYNCRNNHYYSLDELSPLVPTLFEGVKLYVPHGFKQILNREYSKGLVKTLHWGHSFRPYLRLWLKDEVCPEDMQGDQCRDPITLTEFKQTREYTALHETEMKMLELGQYIGYTRRDEFPPLRTDPWLIRHVKRMLGFATNTPGYNNPANI